MTTREQEVLRLIAAGLGNTEIADHVSDVALGVAAYVAWGSGPGCGRSVGEGGLTNHSVGDLPPAERDMGDLQPTFVTMATRWAHGKSRR